MILNLVHQLRQPATTPTVNIVMVHGWLGNEKVMWAFERALPESALVYSVRAPFEAEGGYGWMLPGDEGLFERGLEELREFVRRVPLESPAAPSQTVVIGFSQGAAMGYSLLLSNPELITGAAALAGFLPDQARQWVSPNRLAGKPVFIAHGTDDPTVPVADAERAREAMESCGANVSYYADPVGHKVGAGGMRGLKAWLAGIADG